MSDPADLAEWTRASYAQAEDDIRLAKEQGFSVTQHAVILLAAVYAASSFEPDTVLLSSRFQRLLQSLAVAIAVIAAWWLGG
jgi:hypothetical protein